MSKYRKKPVVIEAVQYTGTNYKELKEFGLKYKKPAKEGGDIAIKTLEGIMYASSGDYIIKGIKGEFYPCKPDIFEATYEEEIDYEAIENDVFSNGIYWGDN